MLTRLLIFTALQLVAAALGYSVSGNIQGSVAAALAMVWLWFAADLFRAARVLRWLRRGAPQELPARVGVLGEFAERAQRLLHSQRKSIHAAERRFDDMLEALQATPNGVVLLDERDSIVWCNQNAARHLALDLARDTQQFVGNLLRDPDFAQYLARRDFSHDVVVTARATGEMRVARVSLQLCTYGAGQKIMLTRDVTAQEHMEFMRRDFVANVSHEIRTPLTVLAGFVETLQTLRVPPEDQTRYLALMAQQAQRMERVVEGLLALSRLEASPPPGMQEWVSVLGLLERCAQEAAALSALAGRVQQLSFPTFGSPADASAIAGSAAELHSAVSNLVANAVRYTPDHARIVVRWTWLEQGGAVLSVQDDGPGIGTEHLPRITERFYRVDRSRARNKGDAGGTGLGLAIVKHVAQRHDAQLLIESALGKGATFSLVFPANRLRGKPVSKTD